MKKKRKSSSKKKKGKSTTSTNSSRQQWNFVGDAGPGCHIARRDLTDDGWVLEWETIDPDDYDDDIPDLAVDPNEKTLTLCNTKDDYVIAYISVFDKILRDRNHHKLQQGVTVANDGTKQDVTTLIVLCEANCFAHLCYIDNLSDDLADLRIESDVQVWNRHPKPDDEYVRALGFPLRGPGPFLCTQGVGGQLTHFFAGNLHAIDFRCPVGTPLLAVADGTVVDVQAENSLTGISVGNLFQWNSILFKVDGTLHDDPLFVEYVHIETASVQPGDRVQLGQVIGTSGSVGFSPEPHLHFAAYRSREDTASTVQVRFATTKDGSTFLPLAGLEYDENGPVSQIGEASTT